MEERYDYFLNRTITLFLMLSMFMGVIAVRINEQPKWIGIVCCVIYGLSAIWYVIKTIKIDNRINALFDGDIIVTNPEVLKENIEIEIDGVGTFSFVPEEGTSEVEENNPVGG